MRILMTTDTVGGVWRYALELADALAPVGAEVTLAAMGPEPTDAQRAEAAASGAIDFDSRALALEWMDEPWHDVASAGEWLLELAQDAQPDVVHLNGYSHATLPWGVPVLVVAHSDVLSWFDAVHGVRAPPVWDRYREEVAAGIASADLLVAPTRAMLSALLRFYDRAGECRVIPNAVRGEGLEPGPKEPFVLAAGRVWDEAKNVAALDRVAERLPWRVVVAGEGRPGGGVDARGHVPRGELDALMRAASIFALPARYEPFGLAALEAGLAGCALVLGDIPSLREVWGDAAAFVEPGDDDALASAVIRLAGDDGARADLGRLARRRALEYAPARMAEQYVAAYASIRALEEAAR